MKIKNLVSTFAIATVVCIAGCNKEAPTNRQNALSVNQPKAALVVSVPLGTASNFSVLAGTTVTNAGASLITGNLGVSPGSAITGFQPVPFNTIMGPGTVTGGLGIVNGTIYASGPVAAQAHVDAVVAYNYLVGLVPDTTFAGVSQLNGLTFKPGVYRFAPSANLLVNGNVYLDFQGDSSALFVFQLGTTLVTMAGSNVIALNTNNTKCTGSNVFWAVGSSATVNGIQFVGTVIANTTITMTSGSNVDGRMLALNGAVTMLTDTISACSSSSVTDSIPTPPVCRDFVTGGGSIKVRPDVKGHNYYESNLATFGVSGGIKNGKFWGQLSYNDHGKNEVKVKSTSVTSYIVIDAVTRQIEGVAKINNKTSCTYKVVVVDNGENGRNDSFSLELSNGYSASGKLKDGNIQLHTKCGVCDKSPREIDNDNDEKDGNNNCDNSHDRN